MTGSDNLLVLLSRPARRISGRPPPPCVGLLLGVLIPPFSHSQIAVRKNIGIFFIEKFEASQQNDSKNSGNAYYAALIVVAVIAALCALGFVILLILLLRKQSSAKAPITSGKTHSAYDNPTYKVSDFRKSSLKPDPSELCMPSYCILVSPVFLHFYRGWSWKPNSSWIRNCVLFLSLALFALGYLVFFFSFSCSACIFFVVVSDDGALKACCVGFWKSPERGDAMGEENGRW